MKKTSLVIVSVTIAAMLFGGCAGKGGAGQAGQGTEDKPLEPVTLKFYQDGGYLTDREFKELIADPVKKKTPTSLWRTSYPNRTWPV